MGIADQMMEPAGWQAALAALAWQVDLGVVEGIGDVALNRYDLAETVKPAARAVEAVVERPQDAVAVAYPHPGPGDLDELEHHALAHRSGTLGGIGGAGADSGQGCNPFCRRW